MKQDNALINSYMVNQCPVCHVPRRLDGRGPAAHIRAPHNKDCIVGQRMTVLRRAYIGVWR